MEEISESSSSHSPIKDDMHSKSGYQICSKQTEQGKMNIEIIYM